MNYTSKTEPNQNNSQVPRYPIKNKNHMAYTSNDWNINYKKTMKTLDSTCFLTTQTSDSSIKTEAKDEILYQNN